MKRLSLLLALSFVLLSFGLANAVLLDCTVEPGKTFIHPSDLNEYYLANQNLYIAIGIQNTEGIYHTGWKMGVTVTSPTGSTVTWVDGGYPQVGSIERLNHFEDDFATTYWTGLNSLTAPDWDGNLPDNFAHDCLGAFSPTGGFQVSDDQMLDRFRLHVNVPVGGNTPADVATICLEQTEADWLFPPESGGPYPNPPFGPFCFDFLQPPNLPPTITDPVMSLTTPHDVAFSHTFHLADAENDAVTNVTASVGTVTFTPGNWSFNWSYDPPCSWVTDGLSHSVHFELYDDVNGHTPGTNVYDVSLDVTNATPTISGACGTTVTVGIEQTKTATFTSTDANVGDTPTWDAVPDVMPVGPFSIVGGVLTFTPATVDADQDFVFTVSATDCAGAVASCQVTFHVISELPFFIKIQQQLSNDNCPYAYIGQHSYVDVIQEQGSEHNLGFDFLLAYDNSALAFLGAYPNPALFEIPGDYEWEYFTYRFVDNCGGSCPSGLLQVVAIADQNDGLHSPVNTILPTDFVLFTLDFIVTNDYTLECSFVPISFFWRDCSDNSIAMNKRSDPTGLVVLQAISRTVYGFNGSYYDVTDPFDGWPTFYGAQDECENGDELKGNIRFIDFYDGGIKICCSDEIDARGDINLNGVLNEIADAVVFTNYFIHGMSAFTINEEGQKAATDVNADGIALSVADLVYLIRIIVGDVLPIEKLNPNQTAANFGFDGQTVKVDAELGAALFVFEGNVDVQLADGAANMQIKSGLVNGNTHTLVYSLDQGQTFSGNVLNTNGNLVSIEAVDYYGSSVATKVLPTTFSVSNYPNPFNPATTIEMALPVATNWTINIYNVAGQRVDVFSGYSEAGITNVVWDASNAASGIYFYKVTTDEGSMTKKMVLLK